MSLLGSSMWECSAHQTVRQYIMSNGNKKDSEAAQHSQGTQELCERGGVIQ